MGIYRIPLLIICVLGIAAFESCFAQTTYLYPHNRARYLVGVGPLTWSAKVADYAKNYANKRKGDCKLIHSSGPYGENLAMSTGDLSVSDAVRMWVSEKSQYDYKSNKCTGKDPRGCWHYTQVVWSKSVRLGCARVRCNTGGTFVICNYDPPGNYAGQWPYQELTASV